MGFLDVLEDIFNAANNAAANTNQKAARKMQEYQSWRTSELKEVVLKSHDLVSVAAAKKVLESRGEYPFN